MKKWVRGLGALGVLGAICALKPGEDVSLYYTENSRMENVVKKCTMFKEKYKPTCWLYVTTKLQSIFE